MKALLICPAERPEVGVLAAAAPLANLPVFGKPLLYHWLEYLANCGAKEVCILAADRPEQVRAITGDGARWGLRVEIIPETRELSCVEAREKYFKSKQSIEPALRHFAPERGLARSNRAKRRAPSSVEHPLASQVNATEMLALIDHFPGLPEEKLFDSYAGFYSTLQSRLTRYSPENQIGVKEIKPGVWVGMRTQISPRAKLIAPCWIGENVLIRDDAVIGPDAILENGVAVEKASTVYESWIGTATFAGALIQLKDSLAVGNTLVNIGTGSIAEVPDEFLLCAMKDRKAGVRGGNVFGRLAALLALTISWPLALLTIAIAKLQGHRAFRPRRAVAPQTATENPSVIIYFELANATGWWRRWPQLWNIARGEFAWIGNRPLTPIEAGKLTDEFERLWLAAPIGLISQGDVEGCTDISSDEARAHASFYAAQANWRLDIKIFFRALKRLVRKKPKAINLKAASELKPQVQLGRILLR